MAEMILYVCPVGPLAEAIEAYWAAVLATIGANSAHEYMPHVTLTGFFHDDDDASLGRHLAALTSLRTPAIELRGDVRVTGALFGPSHHLLTVEAPECRALAGAFRERTPGLRVKDQLHISLAYGFPPTDGPALERLGMEMVDPLLPAAWELRFYERRPDRTWQLHGCWPL